MFVRFFSLLFLAITLGLVSAASIAPPSIAPPAEKRFGTEADAVSILQGLLTQVNAILPQFVAIQQAGNATDDNVTPLVNDLTGALGSAGTQLLNLANPFFGLRDTIDRRQTDSITGLWDEIVSVIETILTVLQSFITVQNLSTLLQLINSGIGLATSIINLVAKVV